MKNIIFLNVYDDKDNIVKQAEATPSSIRFGAVRKIMKLLKIEDANDTWDLLGRINDVWDELTILLTKCFPDMQEDDWDNVKLEELIPAVMAVMRMSFNKLSEIPGDGSKN